MRASQAPHFPAPLSQALRDEAAAAVSRSAPDARLKSRTPADAAQCAATAGRLLAASLLLRAMAEAAPAVLYSEHCRVMKKTRSRRSMGWERMGKTGRVGRGRADVLVSKRVAGGHGLHAQAGLEGMCGEGGVRFLSTMCRCGEHRSPASSFEPPPPPSPLTPVPPPFSTARVGPALQLLWLPLTHEHRLVRTTAATALSSLLVLSSSRPSHYTREWYGSLLGAAKAALADAQVKGVYVRGGRLG
jgi:hypothetical protein